MAAPVELVVDHPLGRGARHAAAAPRGRAVVDEGQAAPAQRALAKA